MQSSPRIDELRQKFHENPRRYFAPLANEYRKAGDPEQAIAICRAHLAQQPGHMSGHVVYAQSLYDAARVDESRVVFEKALSLDPDNAIVLRYLGDISRQKGDSAEALHWYSRALEADPHDSEVAAYIAELTEPLTEATEEHPAAPIEEHAAQPVVAEEEAAPAEVETEQSADSQVELPEPAKEPEVVAAAESPFVTRTMAELYASQGHVDAALDVYHQLAAANPDDAEIADRIRELSSSEAPAEEATAAPTETPPETPSEQQAEELPVRREQIPTMAPVEFADFAPAESEPATPEPAAMNEYAELTDVEADLTFHSEAEEEPAEVPTETTDAHFTETEIAESQRWDADSWGEDLPSDDMELTAYDFSPSDSSIEDQGSSASQPTDARSILEPREGTKEAEAAPAPSASIEEPAVEAEAVEQPAAVDESAEALEIAEYGSASLPLGVLNDAREEIAPEELAASAQGETAPGGVQHEEEHEEEHEDESLVAYSPQTPDEDELAHYEPEGPTVREFFATLGARRPPNGAPESFTAHAAVPSVEPIDDLPLASDAFSNLFADSPVSEADSKAAFALSGAMGAQPQTPEVSKPRATPQAAAPPVPPLTPAAQPAVPAAAQESEEDIRRFREWLDGLADA